MVTRELIEIQVQADNLAGRLYAAGDKEGAALIYDLRFKLFEAHRRLRAVAAVV